jgi:hypothetical protein
MLKQTGGYSLTGSLKQIGQNQALDLLQHEHRDRQKQSTKTSSKNSTATMTRGTRVTRATLAVRTTQASCWQQQGHRPQTTKQVQAATTTTAKYHVILVDFLK